ncbi:MAG: UDP-3-O-(3-hydroxymyristoyl)glucosamine N-acyltransferase [Bacteroidales bacterium]|nr:UDP-3-O-(3-hydroxymyristoyl)glucosamine N-acyltransferase [Bacteroidales bacterium]
MEFTAKMIAEFLKGEIEGNPDSVVNDVSKIEEGKPGTLAFLANPKYAKYLYETRASIILINKDFELEKSVNTTLIRVENAYNAFASLLQLYEQYKPQKSGVEEPSYISKSARIGSNVYIGAFAYVGENAVIGDNVKLYPHVFVGDNAKVGDNSKLYSGVKLYSECQVGKNCIIHSGTVVGSDGFGFAPAEGVYNKIPQVGNVILEDDVEIGANTSVDRATMGSTIIRKGAKLDNLIQIAHNVEIGENSVIISQSGIAGSTKLGKNCILAAQAGIVGHLTIADGVKIGAQSGVAHSIKEEGVAILGSPAFDFRESRKSIAIYKNLPQLRQQVIDLEREIKELKDKMK